MAAVIANETVEAVEPVDRPAQISWGAVLAGLVFVLSLSWLMVVLGSAIGVGIADATDMEAIGEGLGIGAIVWLLLTSLIAYFLGSMLAARLSGKFDDASGMLHGVTLWSIGTALMLVTGYMGIANVAQTGKDMLQGAAGAAAGIAAGTADGARALGDGVEQLADSSVMTGIQAQLKRRAAELVSEAGGPEVSQADAENAIENVDAAAMQTATTELLAGNVDGARQTLIDSTELSDREVQALIQATEQALDGNAGSTPGGDDSALFEQVQTTLSQQVSEALSASDGPGGAEVSARQVEEVVAQLDAETLRAVAMNLIRGDTEGAKNALVVNTSLDDGQIESIVDGVASEAEQRVEAAMVEINQGIEASSDYAQAVLWAAFISSALGLAVSIFGGHLGAGVGEKLHYARRRRTIITE